MRIPVSRFWFWGALTLALFTVLAVSNCGKRDEIRIVQQALRRYNRQRTSEGHLKTQAKEVLKMGKKMSSAFHYTLAGQMFMLDGDLSSAIKALNKAMAADPKIDAPHILLARTYYQLALFDMFDRGLCEVDLVPVESISQDDLHHGHLRLEIHEWLSNGRPKSYAQVLLQKGFDEKARVQTVLYLVKIRDQPIVAGGAKVLEKALRDIGLPKVLPVPHYKPDARTKEILMSAQKELKIAAQKIPMATPTGWVIIEQDVTLAVSKRIEALLGHSASKTEHEVKLGYRGAYKKAIKVEKLTKSPHKAAADGDIDQVRLLISKGADVNVKDKHGITPLHYAAMRGRKGVVELLLANGARIAVASTTGWLDITMTQNFIRAVSDIKRRLLPANTVTADCQRSAGDITAHVPHLE